jgi:hypothetical protein
METRDAEIRLRVRKKTKTKTNIWKKKSVKTKKYYFNDIGKWLGNLLWGVFR